MSGSSRPMNMLVHSKIRARSSTGMPIISAMACRGSSAATSVTKSQRPRSVTWSRIRAVRFWR